MGRASLELRCFAQTHLGVSPPGDLCVGRRLAAVGLATLQAGRLLWDEGLGSSCRGRGLACAQRGLSSVGSAATARGLLAPRDLPRAPRPAPFLSAQARGPAPCTPAHEPPRVLLRPSLSCLPAEPPLPGSPPATAPPRHLPLPAFAFLLLHQVHIPAPRLTISTTGRMTAQSHWLWREPGTKAGVRSAWVGPDAGTWDHAGLWSQNGHLAAARTDSLLSATAHAGPATSCPFCRGSCPVCAGASEAPAGWGAPAQTPNAEPRR